MSATSPSESPGDRVRAVRERLPEGGLFTGHDWRTALEPFPLDAATARELEVMGRVILRFYRAANLLYRLSVQGRQPPWIARWLELGKPAHIIGLQRSASLKHQIPRVLRPDLLLTDHGLQVTELDSVPGGIGLTAWLNQTYAELGLEVVGGAEGMLRGFAGIFGGASAVHVVVSEESATYRPEMDWLVGRLNALGYRFQLRDASPFEPAVGEAVYRFFELFDLANVPAAEVMFEKALAGEILVTPPPKSFLEEKLLLALLWNRRLQEFWRQELGGAFFDRLRGWVPRTWLVDPAPLPPHAAIPELDLAAWDELKLLSQRERNLILKISGYSPEAWGARGVYLGSDLSAAEWSAAVDRALRDFEHSPFILQRYVKPRREPVRWVELASGEPRELAGRTRLCPYYFVAGDGDDLRPVLGGVLATVCPADKKIVHGMSEAIMAPCGVR
jgi:hypothetical protein